MTWLHTWTGLVVGWLLYFVFVTGTIGYFYVEIDRWMRPELPLPAPGVPPARFVEQAEHYLRQNAPAAGEWLIRLPGSRSDYVMEGGVAWIDAADLNGEGVNDRRAQPRWLLYDPVTQTFGAARPVPRATGGGFVLYRMHKHLHYLPRDLGVWLVCACSMIMLVAVISGVIVHKNLVRELFTFRPGLGRRSWLDAHNLLGLWTLPFVVMITFSGLLLFVLTYMPAAVHALYGADVARFEADLYPDYPRFEAPSRANRGAEMLPLPRLLREGARYWGEGAVREISVAAPDDLNARVRLFRALNRTIVRDAEVDDVLSFDGISGRLIEQRIAHLPGPRWFAGALFGLHEGMFAGPVLRWLYFASGVAGCGIIATGLILWTAKRRETTHRGGGWHFGHALVDRLNIATIAGLLIALAVYFWANRLLPHGLPHRAAWEVHALFIGWALTFVYASIRPPHAAWVEQCSIGAGLFAALPVLNAVTTDRHLGITLPAGDWALAGFDLTCFTFGVVLAAVARHVASRQCQHPRGAGDRGKVA